MCIRVNVNRSPCTMQISARYRRILIYSRVEGKREAYLGPRSYLHRPRNNGGTRVLGREIIESCGVLLRYIRSRKNMETWMAWITFSPRRQLACREPSHRPAAQDRKRTENPGEISRAPRNARRAAARKATALCVRWGKSHYWLFMPMLASLQQTWQIAHVC